MCIEMVVRFGGVNVSKQGICVNWCLPLHRETHSEELQLGSEAVLLWPLCGRSRLRSLRERSCGLPLSRFGHRGARGRAALLFAVWAVIHFLRTPRNMDISRSHTSCFRYQVLPLFLKNNFFFSLWGCGGWCTTGPRGIDVITDFCVEQNLRVSQSCVFISPS